ncbi:hypothetical protein POBR111598_10430 [Polynucleobacter brandtiae]
MVKVLPAMKVAPLPSKLVIVVPVVVLVISSVALLIMLLELAILPVPLKESVPADTVVLPV